MQTPQKISLVTQTADILREHISTGKILHILPGENKLATDLQISRKTLRAALQILTTEKLISPSTPGARRKILTEPILPSDQPKRVGILLPRPLDELHASSQDLFRAFRKHLESQNIQLQFHDYPFHKPRQNQQKIQDLFESNPADVWVVLEITRPICKIAQSINLPIIACGGATPPEIYNVAYDGLSAVQHAFHQLINAGHTRICYPIDADGNTHPSYSQLLESKGITPDPLLHFPSFDHSQSGYINLLERLFNRDAPPTAVITAGPRYLITLITWLASKKISVPQDVSILHIGSDPMIDSIFPQISYYSTSYAPLARELNRITRMILKNPEALPTGKKFFMDYVPGSSVTMPKTSGYS